MTINEGHKRASSGLGEETGIILSDCDGTLFQHRAGVGFNKPLFELLKAAKDAGFDVIIVSADPGPNQGRLDLVSEHLFKNRNLFGEIRHKHEFDGTDVLIIFDDDHTSHNAKAKARLSPTDDEQIALLKEALKALPVVRSRIQSHLSPKTP